MQNEREKDTPSAQDAQEALARYGDMLFRICFVLLRQRQDAEDAVQETLIRYLRKAPRFESEQHEKAWLIRVATNICKNALRFRSRYETVVSDEFADSTELPPENSEILGALCRIYIAWFCNFTMLRGIKRRKLHRFCTSPFRQLKNAWKKAESY